MSTRSAQPLRTRIYVDGYNLYYGCLKGTPHKWLDLITLFERHVLPSAATGPGASAFELQQPAIRYYTAEILDKVAKAGESLASQQRYHTALKKLYPDRIECIKGYYSLLQSKARVVDAGNPKRWPRECQEILVWKNGPRDSDLRWSRAGVQMEQPNERLGGEAPIELVRTDAGADRVAQYIAAYQVREW